MRLRAAGALMLCSGIAGAQEGPNHAQLRWEWFYRQRAYPFAQIAPGALDNARMQLGSLRARLRILGAPPIGGSRWQSIGPFSINGTAIGRISAVAIHPTNANIVYIGGAQGGVWKTTDGGSTWTPLTDKQCSLAMGSIALDPVNPEIIYAGTGEQHFSGDSYYGCGVLRSTDGGASWTQLAPLALRVRISRIVILASTAGNVATTTILAATDDGLFRSTNGGTTWTTVRAGIHTDLIVDPSNDQILYAGFRPGGGQGRGVFKSTDGGATWSAGGTGLPSSGVGRINLGIARSSPSTVYAALANVSNSQPLLGLFKTIDGGNTWTQLPATNASCGTQCWYDMHVTVSPADPNIVFFGGLALFRSTDGGQTFAAVGGNIHVDQHLLAFDPQNPQRVYAANDGGIYRSDNGGTLWTGINNGLAITQFYGGISLHPTNSSIVIGGTQDNGTLAYAGVPTWTAIIGGDGGFTAIDYENSSVRYGETQWTVDAANPQNNPGGPRRSDGGGFTRKTNGISLTDPAQFIPPMVMDPSNPRVLYFGTHRIYRTADAGENWTVASPVFGVGTLVAIAPAPSDPATIYAGMSNGPIFVTTNAGETWTQVTTGLPGRVPTDLAVDRADPRTAYATFSGFGTAHVFRTVNGGQTWSNVSSNLPDMPVNAVSLDPATRGFVMIGTDLGVFTSSDSGSTWTILDDGMPNVAVFDIAYNSSTGALIAATHGRGMFQLQLDRGLTLATVPGKRRINFPENSSTVRTDSAAVVLSGTGAGNAQWVATHTAAASWLTLTTASETGDGMVRWTVNPSGRAPGFHVDTISVTSPGAIDSPARVIDTLFIESSGLILSPAHRDTLVSGSTATKSSSVQLTIPSNGSLPWTVTHGSAAWLTITTPSGSGPGTISWTKTAANLRDGVFIDTITVSAPGTLPARIIDTLTVIAPVTSRTCVVNHFLGAPCLDATQLKWLDLGGNHDGTFNLGDLLSYLARPASAPQTPQRRRNP